MLEFVQDILSARLFELVLVGLVVNFIFVVLSVAITRRYTKRARTSIESIGSSGVGEVLNSTLTKDLPFDIQTVLFGTNRGIDRSEDEVVFTNERTEKLKVGQAGVSIPKKRKLGSIKRPRSLIIAGLKLWEQNEDPKKHFVVLKIEELGKGEFQHNAESVANSSQTFENSAFLFVHGFNVTFDNALFRAAQLSYDLNFDGPTFMFSWPAIGTADSYLADMDSAALAAPPS